MSHFAAPLTFTGFCAIRGALGKCSDDAQQENIWKHQVTGIVSQATPSTQGEGSGKVPTFELSQDYRVWLGILAISGN